MNLFYYDCEHLIFMYAKVIYKKVFSFLFVGSNRWNNNADLKNKLFFKHLETSKWFVNRQLDAFKHVAILVIGHLCTYSNCYVNKTLVLILSEFLFFRQNYLFSSLLIRTIYFPDQNCFFICTFRFLTVWTIISEPCIKYSAYHPPAGKKKFKKL